MTIQKYKTESLRSISQIFTPATFEKIVARKEYVNFSKRVKKHYKSDKIESNREVINNLYLALLNSYKSEYIYKNILTEDVLIKKYGLDDTVAFSEFKIGASIADFVLLNGEIKVYEIKSEFDTLTKLDKQLLDYFNFADKVYVVSNSKYIQKLLTTYKDSKVGIIELTEMNELITLKEADKNSDFLHETLFKTLRKNEYISLIESFYKTFLNYPNTKIFKECLGLSRKIEKTKFKQLVLEILKQRKFQSNRNFSERQIPSSLKHICYSLELNDLEFEEFNVFLNSKI